MAEPTEIAEGIERVIRTRYIEAGYRYMSYLIRVNQKNIGRLDHCKIKPISEETYNQQRKEHALKELISCNMSQ